MQRFIVPSFAAAVVIAVSVAVASGSDKPASAAKTIHAESKTVSVEQVDNGPSGPSAGDLLVFRNQLTRAGKALGSLEVACTFVKLEDDYACHGTAFLPARTAHPERRAQPRPADQRPANRRGDRPLPPRQRNRHRPSNRRRHERPHIQRLALIQPEPSTEPKQAAFAFARIAETVS